MPGRSVAAAIVFVLACTCAANAQQFDYAVSMDAGSTGTRVFIYRWTHRHAPDSTPPFSGVWPYAGEWNQIGFSSKTMPGISSYLNNPHEAGESLRGLIEYAKQTLMHEQSRWHTIPVFLKATAGMRIIKNLVGRDSIMHAVRAFLADDTKSPFFFKPTMARVISGEEEGVFGWLAVNYLNGKLLAAPQGLHLPVTVGALDMGGASTQITFQPPHDVLANYFPYYVKDRQVRLYTHSFLYYGYVEARRRVLQNILNGTPLGSSRSLTGDVDPSADENHQYWSPCDYPETRFNFTYTPLGGSKRHQQTIHFHGSGHHEECAQRCRDLLHKDTECWSNVCSFSGVYQPRFGNHTFYAFSAYGRLFESLALPMNFSLNELSHLAKRLCSTPWLKLQAEYPALDPAYLKNYCFLATYMHTILADGYGLNRNTTQVRFKTFVEGQEVTWTLGAVLYEANNYPWGGWDIDRSWTEEWSGSILLLCALLAVGWASSVVYQHRYWSQRVKAGHAYESLESH